MKINKTATAVLITITNITKITHLVRVIVSDNAKDYSKQLAFTLEQVALTYQVPLENVAYISSHSATITINGEINTSTEYA